MKQENEGISDVSEYAKIKKNGAAKYLHSISSFNSSLFKHSNNNYLQI